MFAKTAVVALCLAAFACGGTDAVSPTPPPPGTFALSGRVTDVDTGAPLAGATVTILDGKDAARAAVTDGAGSFRLAGLTPGGFTVRVRDEGYDSAFQGVTFVADMSIDVRMKAAKQTLSGTWTGVLSFTTATGVREDVAVPQLTIVQAGDAVSSTFNTSGPFQGSFSGTLRDASSIGSTTAITGTMTVSLLLTRPVSTCRGTADFTGTVNWTQLSIGATRIVFECGTVYTDVTMSFVRQQ
jgi:hypothetical protein